MPSGDRQIARSLLQALTAGGHETILASRLRTFDARGDSERQARLRSLGERLAQRVITGCRAGHRPDVWFTYHVHHKAPDLLGPRVSEALRIPYVIAEASVAPRQRAGPWAEGYALAVAAIRAADMILSLNPDDVAEVRNARLAGAPSELLAPFIDAAAFVRDTQPTRREPSAEGTPVRLITIAMMRDGAKLASYRALAMALSRLDDVRWELRIVGDGPARAEVEAAFAMLDNRVAFLGARPAVEVAALLGQSEIFVWPAIDEAIGMVFLEAQACGVPVVGGHSPGVAAVVGAGRTGFLAAPGDVDGFAAFMRRLICDRPLRLRMGSAACAYVRAHHDVLPAAARIDAILRRVVTRHHSIAEPSG